MENYYIENIDQDFLASTALLDVIEDPVFLMKEEQDSFKYMYANPAALSVLDLTEIKGLQIGEVLPPELCRLLMGHYRMVQSTRKSVEFTERFQTVNGGFIGETKLNPIVSKNGRCLYVLAIVRDVTERERKKQELLDTQREMEIERKRLSSLVNNNANPVFEFDQHQRFTSLNKMAAEATGFSEEELLGSSILSLVADHCLDEARLNFEKALKGQALDFEVSIYTKSRQIEVLHLNTIPIIIEENVIGVYAIAKAITQQKEMGRLLLESEQRYKSLFENHPHGIMTFDKAGNLSSINRRIESITGHNLTELGGQQYLSIILDEEAEKVRSHFYKTILERQPVQYELTFRHKKGHLIDLQVINIPIIADSQLVGIHGILTDITAINQAQQALIAAKTELEVFWGNSTDPIFYIDTKGDILKVNPAFEKTFGFTEEEMVTGKGTIIPPHMRHDQINIVERLLTGETVNSHDTIRLTKTGKVLNIISSYSPVRNADKEIIGATIIYKDVTELKIAEKELLKSQEKYKIITESTFDIVTMINLNGTIEYVSPAYETISGYSASDCIGKPLMMNIHPEDEAALTESVASLLKGGKPATLQARFKHKEGHYIWMEVSPTPVLENGELKQVFTISRDITERRKLQEKIERMAFYDHLTGIPNRRTFDDQLTKAVDRSKSTGKKVAVLMLDGHKFKQINDQYGHDAGDAVIIEMALRLQSCVHPTATAARLGGDEMGVLLPAIESLEAAEDMAKKILNSFNKPLRFNGSDIKIGASIGIALCPDHSTDEKQLIKSADLALYEAKKLGRDTYQVFVAERV